ncbi:MAG TPA: hypothetical protein VEV82_09730 [Actinomycetota bacterium]|nr:hypothetical protein [Actinomycetota bacterium]
MTPSRGKRSGISNGPVGVADGAGEVRTVAGVGRAELLGVGVGPTAPVDPLVGVFVTFVVHVPVRLVEGGSTRLKEEIDEAGGSRVQGIVHPDLVSLAGRSSGPESSRRSLRPCVRGHDDHLIVIVERADRVLRREALHSGVVGCGVRGLALSGRLLPRLDVPLVCEFFVGARVEAEARAVVGEEVGEALVYLHRNFIPLTGIEGISGDLIDRRSGPRVGRNRDRPVVCVPNGAGRVMGIGDSICR